MSPVDKSCSAARDITLHNRNVIPRMAHRDLILGCPPSRNATRVANQSFTFQTRT